MNNIIECVNECVLLGIHMSNDFSDKNVVNLSSILKLLDQFQGIIIVTYLIKKTVLISMIGLAHIML